MINDRISLQFYQRQGFLNSLHPLTKFLGLIVISFVLFLIPDSLYLHLLFFGIGNIFLRISGYSLSKLQGGRMVLITAVFIAIIQLAFNQAGKIIIFLGPIQITEQALTLAATVSLRFITIILFSYLFVLSTEPTSFVLAMVKLGLPYRFGFSIITAIRMIPMVKNEFTRISYAQKTRGVTYKQLSINQFLKNIIQFLKVMIISMIKRVNSLVISMEGRSFGLYKSRTYIREISYSTADRTIIFCELVLIPIVIHWRAKL